MKTLIETVAVVDDEGNPRELRIFQNWRDDRMGGKLKGLKEVLDEDGNHVNTNDGVTFQVVQTGERLTKV
jgi:hypothetical protein